MDAPPPSLAWIELGVDACLVLSLALTVFHDLKSRRIYDWITGPTFIAGLLLAAAAGSATGAGVGTALANALLGTVPALLLFLLPALFGALGMGDAKLMVALGALLGFPASIGALLGVTLAGGLQGIGAVVLRTPPGRRLAARLGLAGHDQPDFLRSVPYGLAIAAGTAAFRLWQRLVLSP